MQDVEGVLGEYPVTRALMDLVATLVGTGLSSPSLQVPSGLSGPQPRETVHRLRKSGSVQTTSAQLGMSEQLSFVSYRDKMITFNIVCSFSLFVLFYVLALYASIELNH